MELPAVRVVLYDVTAGLEVAADLFELSADGRLPVRVAEKILRVSNLRLVDPSGTPGPVLAVSGDGLSLRCFPDGATLHVTGNPEPGSASGRRDSVHLYDEHDASASDPQLQDDAETIPDELMQRLLSLLDVHASSPRVSTAPTTTRRRSAKRKSARRSRSRSKSRGRSEDGKKHSGAKTAGMKKSSSSSSTGQMLAAMASQKKEKCPQCGCWKPVGGKCGLCRIQPHSAHSSDDVPKSRRKAPTEIVDGKDRSAGRTTSGKLIGRDSKELNAAVEARRQQLAEEREQKSREQLQQRLREEAARKQRLAQIGGRDAKALNSDVEARREALAKQSAQRKKEEAAERARQNALLRARLG
eukprot:gnl/Spiro4/17439_TR9274_c0_g1_i1.p1 gnl/Spiro4/17439_TR9274_c0_g1~~gnl/Spiro4/17439_TR9274_c0_g1_i1.p1  ORF type:complete len:357 (+),score=80.25 gnl/Spiro4/17439_TR9274_c0_g1_i1:18-1088(+)